MATSKKKTTKKKSTKKKSTSKKKKKTTTRKSTARKAKKTTRRAANGTDFTGRLRDRFEDSVEEVRGQLDELEKVFEKRFEELVERGRKAQKELSKRLQDARKDLEKSDVLKRVKDSDLMDNLRGFDARKTASDLRKRADSTVKSSLESVQVALDLPTRTEIDRLVKRVDQLSRKVRTIENKGA